MQVRSQAFVRSFFFALRLAIGLFVGGWIVTAHAFSHEPKNSSTSKMQVSSATREIQKGNAYARIVWMPEIATSSIGGSDISFGLARLSPAVRRGFGVGSSTIAAVAAPVVSLQVSRNTSITFIKLLGDGDGGMIALQLKLGS